MTKLSYIHSEASIGADTEAMRRISGDFSTAATYLAKLKSASDNVAAMARSMAASYPEASPELARLAATLSGAVSALADDICGQCATMGDSLARAADTYEQADDRSSVMLEGIASKLMNLMKNPFGLGLVSFLTPVQLMAFGPGILVGAIDAIQAKNGARWKAAKITADGTCLVSNGGMWGRRWSRWLGASTIAGPLPCQSLGRSGAPHRVPRMPSDLVRELEVPGISADRERIRILEHRVVGPDGKIHSSYTVIVKGTHRWDFTSYGTQDMGSNVQAVANMNSDARQAVIAALKVAGVPSDAPIELVGHSQGGIVVGQLASDPAFAKRYNVVSAMTTGAPVGAFRPQPQVQMLSLEHTSDIVPRLEGMPNAARPNHVTVHAHVPANQVTSIHKSHSLPNYASTARQAQASGDLSVEQWMANRNEKLGLADPKTTTVVHDFAVYKDSTQRDKPPRPIETLKWRI